MTDPTDSGDTLPVELSLEFEILRAIRRIVRKLSEHSRSLSREVGLTVPQLLCLKAIAEYPEDEVTVVGVSRRVFLSPATVSRIVDRLERAGLVLRERKSRDRRRVCLSLTETGQQKYDSLPRPLQDRFLARLENLPEPERVALLAALRQVVDMMEAQDIDASPLLTDDVDVKAPPAS